MLFALTERAASTGASNPTLAAGRVRWRLAFLKLVTVTTTPKACALRTMRKNAKRFGGKTPNGSGFWMLDPA